MFVLNSCNMEKVFIGDLLGISKLDGNNNEVIQQQ